MVAVSLKKTGTATPPRAASTSIGTARSESKKRAAGAAAEAVATARADAEATTRGLRGLRRMPPKRTTTSLTRSQGATRLPRELWHASLAGPKRPSPTTSSSSSPGIETSWPLKWSQYTIAFDAKDHPKLTKTVGTLPLVCTPTINNIAVGKTLIDGGAGLNVISVENFETLQVPYEWLMPSRPFTGVTNGSISPLGQVRLAVTFGT